jgi:hypothetical protein
MPAEVLRYIFGPCLVYDGALWQTMGSWVRFVDAGRGLGAQAFGTLVHFVWKDLHGRSHILYLSTRASTLGSGLW